MVRAVSHARVEITGERRNRDALVLLANSAMRARHRPLAIVALAIWEATLALFVAWPVASWIRATYGRHPFGDQELFRPGAISLFELLDRSRANLSVLATILLLVVIGALFVNLIPLGATLVAFCFFPRDRGALRVRDALVRALDAYPAMFFLLVAALALQALILLCGFFVGFGLGASAEDSLGTARAEQLALSILFIFVLLATVVGILHDLARAATIRFQAPAPAAAQLALNSLRRNPLPIFWSWLWRSGAGLVPVAMGALLTQSIGGRLGLALVAVWIVHQSAIVVRVALRASWLAKALREVDGAHRVVRPSGLGEETER